MTAERIMLVAGTVAFLATLFMVRRREMREKYAVAWIITAIILLTLGFAGEPLVWLAAKIHMAPSALVLLGALTVGYIFAFSVTVSLSRHYKRNLKLAQEIALLEERLRQLEAKQHKPANPKK